ncbi:MAG: hypothetical protein DRR08_25635 [Candidatus Parabeggiatoa sp. nov. 2]|nr:MAG: hypothetical protein B6247_03665 [Beggiatoa sp. 4572_84]RKZ54943.1 MAG: hypothetical protein DRR08_25635 [Gammaproteobacteria bacterium]
MALFVSFIQPQFFLKARGNAPGVFKFLLALKGRIIKARGNAPGVLKIWHECLWAVSLGWV